ncbi:MAG: fibronectin type III domain-containing protein [bacterium]
MKKRSMMVKTVSILLVLMVMVAGCSKKSKITQIISEALEILNVASSNVGISSATISWTTNKEATSRVQYGTTTGYGTLSTESTVFVTSHSVNISGLSEAREYHYRVISTDSDGNQMASADFTFYTIGVLPLPVISNVLAQSITASSAMITWATDIAATSQVEYGTTANYGTSSTLDSTPDTSHGVSVTGLSADTTYHYRVKSRNSSGGESVGSDNTFTTDPAGTTNPPVISNVTATNITATGATITWTTDIISTSQVEYGTTASYGSTTSLNSTLVTSHSVNITGLTASTQYHYRVRSRNSSSQETIGTDNTFTTGSAGQPEVLYDFEDGTTSGWLNDTSAFFGDALGIPVTSADEANSGAMSLSLPFDMTALDLTWNCLNDALYVTSQFDFTGKSKLTIYMYLPASAASDISKAIEATVYVKTGSAWLWHESTSMTTLIPGTWTEVSIDFNDAKLDDNNLHEVVPYLDNVREIGIHVGNGDGTSTTTLYIDDVTVE